MRDPKSENALLIQVKELFVGRRLFEQAALLGLALPAAFWEQLGKLQSAIYSLDEYYESVWNVEVAARRRLWKEIERCLATLAPQSDSGDLLRDIRAYEDVEASFRYLTNGRDFEISTYYHLKTCDVRLSRRLIEMRSGQSRRDHRLRAWNVYDLASELLDDVADLGADVDTFNGNRLVFGLIRHDPRKVIEDSFRFLQQIEYRAQHLLPRLHSDEVKPVYWCFDIVRQLRATFRSDAFGYALTQAGERSLLNKTLRRRNSLLAASPVQSKVQFSCLPALT